MQSGSTGNTALITAVPKVDASSLPTPTILNGVDGSSRSSPPSESQTRDAEYKIPSFDELVSVTPTLGFLAPKNIEDYLDGVCK